MNLKQTEQIVEEAKKLLVKNPFDSGHDLAHHEAVWQTAKDIMLHIEEKVDSDALKIACYWHDAVLIEMELYKSKNARENKRRVDYTAEYLKKRMQELEFEKSFISRTVSAVQYHEYNRKPRNTEGKILYDADKLEVVGFERIKRMLQAVAQKKMSNLKLKLYIKTGKIWIKTLRSKFYFDYSMLLFDHRMKTLQHKLENDKKSRELAASIGIDVDQLGREIFGL